MQKLYYAKQTVTKQQDTIKKKSKNKMSNERKLLKRSIEDIYFNYYECFCSFVTIRIGGFWLPMKRKKKVGCSAPFTKHKKMRTQMMHFINTKVILVFVY